MTGPRGDSPPHVLCVGSANVDHVFEVDALPCGEGKVAARSARWGGGGIAATAAAAISRLGARATWAGIVGDDWLGHMLLDMFQDLGVSLPAKAVVPGARTPMASVFVNPAGERWLGYYRGEGLDVDQSPPELPDMASVDAVVATRSPDSLTTEVLRLAALHGIPRVLDAESGTATDLELTTNLADHVIFAETGLASYTGVADTVTALGIAADRLPGHTLGVTLGPRGSAWKTAQGVLWITAPHVVARDTTGCGDVFHGAYALAIAEGAGLPDAVRFATAVAALKAERGRSWEGMPTRPDVDALLQKGWT